MSKPILAIDQGTTGTTALIVEFGEMVWPSKGQPLVESSAGRVLGRATVEFPQHFPKPGWVSHDSGEIWASVESAVTGALKSAGLAAAQIAAVGITNQRETTVVWDRASRKPIDLAIVWQCRRTADVCDELKKDAELVARVQRKTGLVIDAYFSATKIAWLLDHTSGAREKAEAGKLAFGTIDCFLVDKLTGGAVHATDVTNASRTLLMDLETATWAPELLKLFRVPAPVLPKIVGNAERVGTTASVGFLPDGIPITGMAGDQQAALFGQGCVHEGDAKCTYGTGAFVLMNLGAKLTLSENGLVTTAAWRIGGVTTYALEGSAFIAGAAVQWLRDGLGIISNAKEVEGLARRATSSDGVIFVPALAGLGAPYWDSHARGAITGITRGTTAAHLARATLEGIALEVRDILDAMTKDAGRRLTRLRVDGGASANDLLMQLQADVADLLVERPREVESTGWGAALLAGLGSGLLSGVDEASRIIEVQSFFQPMMDSVERKQKIDRWADAIRRARAGS